MTKARTESRRLLKEFIGILGISSLDLACRLHPPVRKQTIVRWYRGSRVPSVDYQKQLYKLSEKTIPLSGWKTDTQIARDRWMAKHPVAAAKEQPKKGDGNKKVSRLRIAKSKDSIAAEKKTSAANRGNSTQVTAKRGVDQQPKDASERVHAAEPTATESIATESTAAGSTATEHTESTIAKAIHVSHTEKQPAIKQASQPTSVEQPVVKRGRGRPKGTGSASKQVGSAAAVASTGQVLGAVDVTGNGSGNGSLHGTNAGTKHGNVTGNVTKTDTASANTVHAAATSNANRRSVAASARWARFREQRAAQSNPAGSRGRVRRTDTSDVSSGEGTESGKVTNDSGNAENADPAAGKRKRGRPKRVDSGMQSRDGRSGVAKPGGETVVSHGSPVTEAREPAVTRAPAVTRTAVTVTTVSLVAAVAPVAPVVPVAGKPSIAPNGKAAFKIEPSPATPSKSNHESRAKVAENTKVAEIHTPAIVVSPAGPVRKNHSECSPDNPMERLMLARSGGIQFEVVSEQGVVLEKCQDIVSARNILDSRIHPTSHAVRCKFCWTQVSVYTPPRPEVTERLARAVLSGKSRVEQ